MLHFSLLLFLNLLFFFSSFTFFVKFLSSSLLYSSLLFVSWAFLPVRPNDPPGLNPLPPLCLLMAALALVAEGFWKACKDLMLNSAQGSVISAAPRDVSSPSARHTWPAARTPRHTEKMKLSECVVCDPLLGHGTLVSFVWSSVKQTFLFFHFPLFWVVKICNLEGVWVSYNMQERVYIKWDILTLYLWCESFPNMLPIGVKFS